MNERKSFYVIDDDPFVLGIACKFLEEAGHKVWRSNSPVQALAEIKENKPDCVLTDLMMPEMDGLTLVKHIRAAPALAHTKVIVITSKNYEFDRRRAREMGADGYITKPIHHDVFLETIRVVLEDKIDLRYWGVRGTLPVPGEKSLRYGGNTSCVTLSFAHGNFFIFDAGSGIKELSNHLMSLRQRINAHVFISHPHWDHINALPFFVPLYIPGNSFEICGASHGDLGMQELISAQMNGVYFPITIHEFGSSVHFRDLGEGKTTFGEITVSTMLLSHPGNCLGYRVDYNDKAICYVTDNELFLPGTPEYSDYYEQHLIDFCRGADILITDTTYNDEAYKSKVGWGHSSVGQAANFAHRAEVKELHLFHHDPDETDADIDRKLESAQRHLAEKESKTRVVAPAEGGRYFI